MLNCHSRNAADEGGNRRGWIIGHFLDPADGVRFTSAVEVKWGLHAAGERRAAWACGRRCTTVTILVSGRFRVDFASESFVLERQGDYVMWGADISHRWEALANTVIVTVRWESR